MKTGVFFNKKKRVELGERELGSVLRDYGLCGSYWGLAPWLWEMVCSHIADEYLIPMAVNRKMQIRTNKSCILRHLFCSLGSY